MGEPLKVAKIWEKNPRWTQKGAPTRKFKENWAPTGNAPKIRVTGNSKGKSRGPSKEGFPKTEIQRFTPNPRQPRPIPNQIPGLTPGPLKRKNPGEISR